jgi:hypothetical protein
MDTQSGLRAFSRGFVGDITRLVRGSRYEMEMHCLLLALSQRRLIVTMPISTIYLNNNASFQVSGGTGFLAHPQGTGDLVESAPGRTATDQLPIVPTRKRPH